MNSQLIFCQACFDSTHDISLSVNSVNSNGACAKCGSFATMSADAIMRNVNPTPKAHIREPQLKDQQVRREMLEFHSGVVDYIKIHYPLIADWWDGWTYDFYLDFISSGPERLRLQFRNYNSKEIKEITLLVTPLKQ